MVVTLRSFWHWLREQFAVIFGALSLITGLLGLVEGPFPYPGFFTESIVEFHRSISQELMGIGITVLIIDTATQYREEREVDRREKERREWELHQEEKRRDWETQQLKERLIREVGHRDYAVSMRAFKELGAHGWLDDGSLEGAFLSFANLEGAVLSEPNLKATILDEANLQKIDWYKANLENASLRRADLADAILIAANLEGANLERARLEGALIGACRLSRITLTGANLQDANLENANLEGANLRLADLRNANLKRANLQRADLLGAKMQGTLLDYVNLEGAELCLVSGLQTQQFHDAIVLPDGSKWTTETDLRRFTDTDHPNYWRSGDPSSPAHPHNYRI